MIGTTILFISIASILTALMAKYDSFQLSWLFVDEPQVNLTGAPKISNFTPLSDMPVAPIVSDTELARPFGPVLGINELIPALTISESPALFHPSIDILGASCPLLSCLLFVFVILTLTLELKHRFTEKMLRLFTKTNGCDYSADFIASPYTETQHSVSDIWSSSDFTQFPTGYHTFQPVAPAIDEICHDNDILLSVDRDRSEEMSLSSTDECCGLTDETSYVKPLNVVKQETQAETNKENAAYNFGENNSGFAEAIDAPKPEVENTPFFKDPGIPLNLNTAHVEIQKFLEDLTPFDWSLNSSFSDQELVNYAIVVTDMVLKGLDLMLDIEALFTQELRVVLSLQQDSIDQAERRSRFPKFNNAVEFHLNEFDISRDRYRPVVRFEQNEPLRDLFREIIRVWQSPRIIDSDLSVSIPRGLQSIAKAEREINAFPRKWKKIFEFYLRVTPQQAEMEASKLEELLTTPPPPELTGPERAHWRQKLFHLFTDLSNTMSGLLGFYTAISGEVVFLVSLQSAVATTLSRHIRQTKGIQTDLSLRPKIVDLVALQNWCKEAHLPLDRQGKIATMR